MRSLLTMLGVIIGVGAVIGAVSLTTGATKQVEDQVASLGENVITVFSGNFTSGGMRGGWGSAPTLTLDDAKAISQLPDVAARGRLDPRSSRLRRAGPKIDKEYEFGCQDPGGRNGDAEPRKHCSKPGNLPIGQFC